ncbi:MAG: HNH endonuclease [Pseudomonadota bacterium]
MSTVFFHIGWMKHYQGQTADDCVRGGGSFVDEQDTGHEVCNFLPIGGYLYGYVQVGKERDGLYQEGKFNLGRLGAPPDASVLHDVTVVWTAHDPVEQRRKIVGWYDRASIHRNFQLFERPTALQSSNGVSGYWISVPVERGYLLSETERLNEVPRMQRGFPGISPIWFADSAESQAFVTSTLAFIAAYQNHRAVYIEAQVEQTSRLHEELESANYYADNEDDARRRVLREVVQRRGQAGFRNKLLSAYGARCAVTGCDAVDALEAAHLVGYNGVATQIVTNGVLLRADIHTLFDLGLLAICPQSLTVVLADSLRSTSYGVLHGQALALPANPLERPSAAALHHNWTKSRTRSIDQGGRSFDQGGTSAI